MKELGHGEENGDRQIIQGRCGELLEAGPKEVLFRDPMLPETQEYVQGVVG